MFRSFKFGLNIMLMVVMLGLPVPGAGMQRTEGTPASPWPTASVDCTGQLATANQCGMVRMQVVGDDQRAALVAQGILVYARLFSPEGAELLYLPGAVAEQVRASFEPGLSGARLETLDDGSHPGNYYLGWVAEQGALEAAQEAAVVLEVLGEQAVILATEAQETALHDAGIHLAPLELHRLVEYSHVPAAPQIETPDPFVAAFINQVTQTNVINHVRRLSGETPVTTSGGTYTLGTRFTPNEQAITRATRYVYETLCLPRAGYGLPLLQPVL